MTRLRTAIALDPRIEISDHIRVTGKIDDLILELRRLINMGLNLPGKPLEPEK